MGRVSLAKGFLLSVLLGASAPAFAGAACLLFPLSCLAPSKKYGDEVEAKVLSITNKHTDAYVVSMSTGVATPSPLDNTREFYVGFEVGQTRYIAWKKDTVVQMAGLLGGYKPTAEKWIGKPIKLRFKDESWMGMKTPVASFKTPEGKDWELVIISIIGPDGVDECPPFLGLKMNMGHCGAQGGIDRPKREAEQLAKLKSEGKRPIWETQDATTAEATLAARQAAAANGAGAPSETGAADAGVVAGGASAGTNAATPTPVNSAGAAASDAVAEGAGAAPAGAGDAGGTRVSAADAAVAPAEPRAPGP